MKVPLKSVAFGIQGTNTASLVKEIFRRCGKVSLLITKKLYNVEHDQPLNMWLLHVIEVIGDALVILTWHFPYKTNFIFAFHSILLLILLINQIHVEEFTINFVNILKQNSIKYIKLKWRDNAFVLIFLLSSLLQILETEVWNWKLLYNSQYKLTGTFAPSIYISFLYYLQVMESMKYVCVHQSQCESTELYDLLQEMDRRFFLIQDFRWEFSMIDVNHKDTISQDEARWSLPHDYRILSNLFYVAL